MQENLNIYSIVYVVFKRATVKNLFNSLYALKDLVITQIIGILFFSFK